LISEQNTALLKKVDNLEQSLAPKSPKSPKRTNEVN